MTTEYLVVDSCKNPNILAGKFSLIKGLGAPATDIDGNPDSAVKIIDTAGHFLTNPWSPGVSGQTWMIWSLWFKLVQGQTPRSGTLIGASETDALTSSYSDAYMGLSTTLGIYVRQDTGDVVSVFDPDYDTWYHIEYAHRFGNASTGNWVVYINGNEVASGVGDCDGEPWNYFALQGISNTTGTFYDTIVYDDIILAVSDDPAPPRLSMLKVAHLIPTGTSQGQWTGSDGDSVDNHLLVDDGDAGSADYVESTAGDNEVDLYTHDGIPAGATPVVAQLAVAANLDALGTDDFSAVLDSNGSQATEAFVLGTGSPEWKVMSPVDSDPDGSVPWTKAKIDAATFGVSS